jgi:hypothetical protein
VIDQDGRPVIVDGTRGPWPDELSGEHRGTSKTCRTSRRGLARWGRSCEQVVRRTRIPHDVPALISPRSTLKLWIRAHDLQSKIEQQDNVIRNVVGTLKGSRDALKAVAAATIRAAIR